MPVLKVRYTHILAVMVPAVVCLAAYLQPFVPPRLLFLDPLVAAMEADACCKTYLGIMSTFGILLWVATAAVCVFAALVLHAQSASRRLWEFAAMAGLLTAWLALDDAFLVHENIAPKLGIPQIAVLLFIATFAMAYVAKCWRVIVSLDAVMFGLAVGFLATSVGIDVVHVSTSDLHFLAEDGAKFVGIVCWTCFHLSEMKRICDPREQDVTQNVSYSGQTVLAGR